MKSEIERLFKMRSADSPWAALTGFMFVAINSYLTSLAKGNSGVGEL